MNRKLFFFILVPALILIGIYAFMRYSVKAAVNRDEEKFSTSLKEDSSAAKKTSILDLKPLLQERLQQLVAKASSNRYHLAIGKMDIDVLASTAALYHVVLKPTNEADKLYNKNNSKAYAVSFEKMEVTGINVDDVLTQKTMDYKLVKLTNPVFEIYQRTNKDAEATEEFTQRFLKEMKKLSVEELIVKGGKIIIHKGEKKNSLNDVTIAMQDILIDSVTRKDKQRFLFAKQANLSFRNYKTIARNGYTLSMDKVNVNATTQKIVFAGISYQPALDKKEFSRRQKSAKEYFRFSTPSITLNGVDWWNLVNGEDVIANELHLNNAKLFVYLDRSLPSQSRVGNFPAQLLMKLPLKLNIDHLYVANLDLAYEEYNPISKRSGTIYMDNIRMNIANISNLSAATKPITVDGSALFMHKIPVTADFVFQRNKSGSFTAHINSERDFEGSLINSFAPSLGLVEFKDGTLQKLDAVIKGDELKANGKVTVLYKDLKLHLLEKDSGEKELDKKGFTTFFANSFVLKKDNPKKGQSPRTEQVDFSRIPEGGFFMLVWKTTMAGALKTIGAPVKIASKTVSTKPN